MCSTFPAARTRLTVLRCAMKEPDVIKVATAKPFADASTKPLPTNDNRWKPPLWIYKFLDFRTWEYVQHHIPLIRQAQRDGIENIAPILLALSCDPATAKKRVGRAVWRRVHHSTLHQNMERAELLLRTGVPLADLVDLYGSALRDIRRAAANYPTPALHFAIRVATNRTQFYQAVRLATDALHMDVTLNPEWSLKRLRKEHDQKAIEIARRTTNGTAWAEPWTAEIHGFIFTLLRSDQDFADEGLKQRHCIASYLEAARQGKCVVMRIQGPERATVLFRAQSLRFSEVKARFNKDVSTRCYEACIKAGRLFKHNRPPAVMDGNGNADG